MKNTLLLILTLFVLQAEAQDLAKYGIAPGNVPTGLEVGETAPDFTAKTSDGGTFKLSDALHQNAVALVFYRGYWCGYCSRALEAYSDSLSYLIEIGVEVVAVTPETYKYVAETADKAGVDFGIISDTDGEIMRAYDVDFRVTEEYDGRVERSSGKSLASINGSEEAELPIPATYLIVRDGKSDKGVVVWRHFDPDYSKRASVKQITEALKRLN